MHTQPILAFDSACSGASIAVMTNGHSATRRIGQTAQAAELLPAIASAMAEAGVAFHALSCIVSTIGPGSFTGVRIGLAALHGLVLVHNTPVKLITTLEAMAWAVAGQPSAPPAFWLALRAGKGEMYCQRFMLSGDDPTADHAITLKPEAHAGWDAPCFGNHLHEGDAQCVPGPDAAVMARIAHRLPETPLSEALPLYIRAPDAIAAAPHPWLQAN